MKMSAVTYFYVVYVLLLTANSSQNVSNSPGQKIQTPESCTIDDVELGQGSTYNHVTLTCQVHSFIEWTFSVVQNWALTVSVENLKVHINCDDIGEVVIRQPYKARGLSELKIASCTVHSVYDYDFAKALQTLPYTIRNLEIVNSQYVVTTKELIYYYRIHADKILSLYPCELPESLERYVARNTDIFIHEVDLFPITDAFMDDLNESKQIFASKQRTCNLNNLSYYEKSHVKGPRGHMYSDLKITLETNRFPNIETFNFSYLELSQTPSKLYDVDWWDSFPRLKVVDLSYNHITKIDFRYGSLGHAIQVNMSHNNISILQQEDLLNLETFYPSIIDISRNPLRCTCEQRHFLQFLKNQQGAFTSSYANLSLLECFSPISVSGKKLITLTEQNICPLIPPLKSVNTVLFVLLPVLLVALVGFLVYLLYKCKYIDTQLSSHFKCENPEEAIATFLPYKQYDAFVSYSSLDEQWVYGLCKILEECSYNFNLCLHHKNFIPGACISDNIIESVEKSHHTVVVLSQNFLESDWCILEFKKAFFQSLAERNRHLVVVILEDVDLSELQPDMKFVLQNYTYIHSKDSQFLEKLINTLANKGYHRHNEPHLKTKPYQPNYKSPPSSEPASESRDLKLTNVGTKVV